MNVRQIISDYLKANGYDGLYNSIGCGCGINDMIPCQDCCIDNCEPAYHHECKDCQDKDNCDMYEEDSNYPNEGCYKLVRQNDK